MRVLGLPAAAGHPRAGSFSRLLGDAATHLTHQEGVPEKSVCHVTLPPTPRWFNTASHDIRTSQLVVDRLPVDVATLTLHAAGCEPLRVKYTEPGKENLIEMRCGSEDQANAS